MWTDGMARLWPAWEIYIGDRYTIPAVFAVALIMGLVFAIMIAYPWIEKRLTGDNAHHNLLQRPRDVPVRTGIGAMAISFYVVLTLSCINDIIAYKLDISLNAMTWIGRIGLLTLPPIAYFVAYRFCIGLQRSDRQVLDHGIETGIIKRLPHGQYVEVHQPLVPGRRNPEEDEQARFRWQARFGITVPSRPRRREQSPRGCGASWRARTAEHAQELPGVAVRQRFQRQRFQRPLQRSRCRGQ